MGFVDIAMVGVFAMVGCWCFSLRGLLWHSWFRVLLCGFVFGAELFVCDSGGWWGCGLFALLLCWVVLVVCAGWFWVLGVWVLVGCWYGGFCVLGFGGETRGGCVGFVWLLYRF